MGGGKDMAANGQHDVLEEERLVVRGFGVLAQAPQVEIANPGHVHDGQVFRGRVGVDKGLSKVKELDQDGENSAGGHIGFGHAEG